ncbi:MAG: hypothetical protein Q9199_001514 [Rusavskia elegans]
MPNDTIGWTGIPSDVSFIQRMGLEGEEAQNQPQFPNAPSGLEPEDALVVRQGLPANFWHYSQRMTFKMFDHIKDELAEEADAGDEPSNWDDERLLGYVHGQVRGLLKGWMEEPYTGLGKSEFQKLRDELNVRYRKEHIRLFWREYRKEVYRMVYVYVHTQSLPVPGHYENGFYW